MSDLLLENRTDGSVPIIPVRCDGFEAWLGGVDEATRNWAIHSGFNAKPGTHLLVPDAEYRLATVIAGIDEQTDPWALAQLPAALPAGAYYIHADWDPQILERAAMAWGLGAYQFTRYKPSDKVMAKLVIDLACSARFVKDQVKAIYLVRDLINTPASDMMPQHLAKCMSDLASEFNAQFHTVDGDALLSNNYPAIHAVGRASVHSPQFLSLEWGQPDRPNVTLIGKGVCFDSGGLDIKNAAGMRYMKKDMGGAAQVLGLARLVMSTQLPVRLRVLVPAVENAISGNAYRPGDIITTRSGTTIEVDNTDAEGRIVLADALSDAGEHAPDLIIDFATLTGAARVAVGTALPAMFCNNEPVAEALLAAANEVADPIWRLPLHQPYRELISSQIADVSNSGKTPYAGAITAGLFLETFVPAGVPWVHFDVMAWNTSTKPGRPEGGEAMGIRGVLQYLQATYGAH